jgi:hypothetical protein
MQRMDIEILEFYPIEKNDTKQTLTGTLRIRLVDLEIEILGIYVSKDKDFWYFNLPGRKGVHHETGQLVRYPAIVFTDRDKQREFIDTIRSRGRSFVEQRLADKEKPLVFPQKQQNQSKQFEAPRVQNNATGAKKTVSFEKPKVNPSIARKEWRDLPPRPQVRSGSKFSRL